MIPSKWWPWRATHIWSCSRSFQSLSPAHRVKFQRCLRGSLSTSRVRGRCLKTWTLRYPHKKKSQGLKSEERRGYTTSSRNEVRRPRNVSCEMAWELQAVWVVAPSCLTPKTSVSYSSIFGRKKFFHISQYRLEMPISDIIFVVVYCITM